ncbi:MAG: hypothetical protein GY822_19475 [Deltaproteobacteria bacterium]|nr:hypothetical protein [Deltaproteobacteria bacterium]
MKPAEPTPLRLGDLLISAKVLTEHQLHAALEEQRQYGGRLGSTLVRMGFVSEDLLVKALAKHLQIADVDPQKSVAPSVVLARFPKESWERMRVFPVGFDEQRRVLVLATFDPLNKPVLDEISRIMGTAVEPRIAGESRILAALKQAFGAVHSPDTASTHWQQSLHGIGDAASSNVYAALAILELSAEKGLCVSAEAGARSQKLRSHAMSQNAPQNVSLGAGKWVHDQ